VLLAHPPETRAARARAAGRALGGLLRGRPTWVTLIQTRQMRECVQATLSRWRPEIVQAEYLTMAALLPRRQSGGPPSVLVDYDARPGDNLQARSRAPSLIERGDALAWRRFRRRVLPHPDGVVVFTEADASLARRDGAGGRVTIIPRGASVPRHALSPSGAGPSQMVFVGNFAHPPNVAAAQRLVHHILPRVRVKQPCELVLVGPSPPPEIASSHVIVTGEVSDVAPYLDRASVVVAPLAHGGGMRIKVLEALAAGKALVASPLALDGLSVTDGREVLVAETDDEFADAIGRLLSDSHLRVHIARGARRWAQSALGWDRAVSAYERLYSALLPAPVSPASL
jgi:glycosyltransferase involved in cell wall biosynthesis